MINLKDISDIKTEMELTYEKIYKLNEAIIEKDRGKINEYADELRRNAKLLYIEISNITLRENNGSNIYSDIELSMTILEKLMEDIAGCDIEVLRKKSRKRKLVEPRQVHMALMIVTFGISSTGSGKYYDGRDHATVLYAKKTVRNRYQTDSEFRKKYAKAIDHCIRFDLSRNSTKTQDFLNEK